MRKLFCVLLVFCNISQFGSCAEKKSFAERIDAIKAEMAAKDGGEAVTQSERGEKKPVGKVFVPKLKNQVTIGMSLEKVIALLGTPDFDGGTYLRYGTGNISLDGLGKVYEWKGFGRDNRMSRFFSAPTSPQERKENENPIKKPFSEKGEKLFGKKIAVGMTKEEVWGRLGTPTYDSGDYWKYGSKNIVRFDSDDIVYSFDGFEGAYETLPAGKNPPTFKRWVGSPTPSTPSLFTPTPTDSSGKDAVNWYNNELSPKEKAAVTDMLYMLDR